MTMPKGKQHLVYGVGICDAPTRTDGKQNAASACWMSRLRLIYSPASWKRHPTYKACAMHPLWLRFSVFKSWFNANHRVGYALDKDLLVPGNKVYGPDTCCFVPQWLNNLLGANTASRGKYPQGVCRATTKSEKYLAQINIFHKNKYLGIFDSIEEAHRVYVKAKCKHVMYVIGLAYDQDLISEDVYHSVMLRARKGIL